MAQGAERVRAKGHSAQDEIDRLSDASVWIFDIPPSWLIAVLIIPVSFLLGLYLDPFGSDRWWFDWPLYSIVFFALPAWLAAVFSFGYLRLIKAKTYLYRTMLLAFINLLIIGAILIPGKVVEVTLDIPPTAILIYAYSVLVMINHLSNLMTATKHAMLALPATLAQPVLGYAPILFDHYDWSVSFDVDWAMPVLAIISLVAFLVAGHIALFIGTRPLMLTYGVSGVDVFRAFLDHWTGGRNAGREVLEDFFRIFAEPVHTHATIVRFRERGGGVTIATLVTPSIHPGPWGYLGGSDLPTKIREDLGDGHGEVLTFHGASDHDLNPITFDEVGKVTSAISEGIASMEGYSDRASPFIRLSGDFDACAQAFNGAVLAVHTSSPQPTDDVDGPTGFAIEKELEAAGATPGAFVDSHNCLAPGTGGVSFGTPKSRQLQVRLREAAERALKEEGPGLRIGVGNVPGEGSRSMGPLGTQVVVVEAGGKRMAWVLMDGNNMVCGLRETIRDRVLERVDEAEVLTTDTHVVNVRVGGFNPVGTSDPSEDLERRVLETLDAALKDLRDAEVAGARVEVDEVLVFGRGNTIRLSSAINSAVATAKGALLAAFGFASVISSFAMYLLRGGL